MGMLKRKAWRAAVVLAALPWAATAARALGEQGSLTPTVLSPPPYLPCHTIQVQVGGLCPGGTLVARWLPTAGDYGPAHPNTAEHVGVCPCDHRVAPKPAAGGCACDQPSSLTPTQGVAVLSPLLPGVVGNYWLRVVSWDPAHHGSKVGLLTIKMERPFAGVGRPGVDVPSDHWSYQAIDSLAKMGVLRGYPDGEFGAELDLAGPDAVVLLARSVAAIKRAPLGELASTDTAASYLQEQGALDEGTLQSLRAGASVTRGRFADLIVEAARRLGVALPATDPDVEPQSGKDILQGDPTGGWRLPDALTRREAASLLYRWLEEAGKPRDGAAPVP